VRSIAPIVSADGARAGEDEHASVELFPAATTTVRPAALALATAESMAELADPPRLKLMMPAPPGWLWVTQLIPATTDEEKPEPVQSRTRTATTRVDFATPYVEPAIVPAT